MSLNQTITMSDVTGTFGTSATLTSTTDASSNAVPVYSNPYNSSVFSLNGNNISFIDVGSGVLNVLYENIDGYNDASKNIVITVSETLTEIEVSNYHEITNNFLVDLSNAGHIDTTTPPVYLGQETLLTRDNSTFFVSSGKSNNNINGNVFVYRQNNSNVWTYNTSLYSISNLSSTHDSGSNSYPAKFGNSLCCSENGYILFVGAPDHRNASGFQHGSVSVFNYNDISNSWSLGELITETSTNNNHHFGFAICCSKNGRKLFIGNSLHDYGNSEVHLYEYDDATASYGKNTSFDIKPTLTNGLISNFGNHLACDAFGTTLVVGSDYYQQQISGNTRYPGNVHVFGESSGTWSLVKDLYADISNNRMVTVAGTEFNNSSEIGRDVAIDDSGNHIFLSTAVVGNTSSQKGVVYNFKKNGSTYDFNSTFFESASTTTSLHFGNSIQISANGKYFVSTTNGYTAYIYEDVNGTWTKSSQSIHGLLSTESKYTENSTLDEFGNSVSISGNGKHIAIGARSYRYNNPTSSTSNITGEVFLINGKQEQSVTMSNITEEYGKTINLFSSSTDPNSTVTYTDVNTSGIYDFSLNTISLIDVGTTTIRASYNETYDYEEAYLDISLQVIKAAQIFSYSAAIDTQGYIGVGQTSGLSAITSQHNSTSVSTGLAVTLTISGNTITYDPINNVVEGVQVGSSYIVLTQGGNTYYNAKTVNILYDVSSNRSGTLPVGYSPGFVASSTGETIESSVTPLEENTDVGAIPNIVAGDKFVSTIEGTRKTFGFPLNKEDFRDNLKRTSLSRENDGFNLELKQLDSDIKYASLSLRPYTDVDVYTTVSQAKRDLMSSLNHRTEFIRIDQYTEDGGVYTKSSNDYVTMKIYHPYDSLVMYHINEITGSVKKVNTTNFSQSSILREDGDSNYWYVKMPFSSAIGGTETYDVTIVSGDIYLDGVKFPSLPFVAEGTYIFDQSDATNAGYELFFSREPYSLATEYTTGVTKTGTPGTSGSSTSVTLPSDFSGTLYYLSSNHVLTRDNTYYVKVEQNLQGLNVYSIATSVTGTYYKNMPITLTASNQYYFEYYHDTSDPSANTHSHVLVFGETVDGATTYAGTAYYGGSPGTYRSAVYVDLSGYSGNDLFYYNASTTKMGYNPPPTVDYSYNVTIANDVFVLNGQSRLFIDFDANKKYLFDQSDSTNVSYDIEFGKLPDDNANMHTEGITLMGSPGQTGAYTLLSLSSTYLDSLFYFHATIAGKGPTIPYDVIYYVKVENNVLVISNSSAGPYDVVQYGTGFTAPNKYYFNVADSTNSGYEIVFGTTIDNSGTIYEGTVYNENTEGTTGAFVYLDLNDYTGQSLYMFERNTVNMGYRPPTSTSNTYEIVMDSNQIGLTLNGSYYPVIDFSKNQTYVFKQSDSSNTGSTLVFGSTLYGSTYYTDGITSSGTAGQNESYIELSLGSDFSGSLFYYTTSSVNDTVYYVRTATDVDGKTTYQFSSPNVESGFTSRPNQIFTKPNNYLFHVGHSSNTGYVLTFGTELEVEDSAYVSRDGTSGTNNAYVRLTLSSYTGEEPFHYFDTSTSDMGYHHLVTGSLDTYDLLESSTVYYVKVVQNHLGETVYALSSNANGTYYNQTNLTLSSPTKYLFVVQDDSNVGYELSFGTEADGAVYSSTVYRARNEGETLAVVYLDLTGYSGDDLVYYDASYSNMGYYVTTSSSSAFKENGANGTDIMMMPVGANTIAHQHLGGTSLPLPLYKTSDFVNWTSDTNFPINIACVGIKRNENIILAYGQGTADYIAWSEDGVNWTGLGTLGIFGSTTVYQQGYSYGSHEYNMYIAGVNDVEWNGGAWVLLGHANSATDPIYTSLDGKTWTNTGTTIQLHPNAGSSYSRRGLSYSNILESNEQNTIVIPGFNFLTTIAVGTYSLSNPTSISWTNKTISGRGGGNNQILYGGHIAYNSADGLWHIVNRVFAGINVNNMTYTPHVATYYAPANQTTVYQGFTRECVAGGGMLLVQYESSWQYATSGLSLYNSSNATWSVTDMPLGASVPAYSESSNTWYVYNHTNGKIYTSTNGSSWSQVANSYYPNTTVGAAGTKIFHVRVGASIVNFTTTIVNNIVTIDGTAQKFINFHDYKEETIHFQQSDSTNINNPFYFSRDPYSITPYYDVSVNAIGTPGQTDAYTSIVIPSDFSGNLYYLNESEVLERDYTYYVKITNVTYPTSQSVFSFSTSISGTYHNQIDLNLSAPNRYYFEYYFDLTDQSGNLHEYQLDFGTTIDSSNVYTGTVHKGTTPGEYRSAVYLDLSGYSGSQLYAYHDGSANMGYSPPPTNPDFSYNVTVSNNKFYLNGVESPQIDFDANKTYLFIQSDSSNTNNGIKFGKLPDELVVTEGVKIVGTPGHSSAYTLMTVPSDFTDSLFYFHMTETGWGPALEYDVSYNVKVVQNQLGENVYSISTAGGPYYTQPSITFTGPNNKYYFDITDATYSGYKIVFGTQLDVSSSIYNGTVYGSGKVFLDLTDYNGSTLYLFDETNVNMSYLPPSTPNTSYTVSMSSDQLYIYLDGVENPTINFSANQTYVFLQDGSSNVDYQLMFSQTYGMLPYYTTNYRIVGTLGQSGAYTQLSLDVNFTGNMFYFLKSLTREYTYYVKRGQNYLSDNVYAMSDVSAGATHYLQPYINMSAPNRYYFEVEHSDNTGYQLVVGTQSDISSSIVENVVTRGRTPGANNSFVHVDLTSYTGDQLRYFDVSYTGMGWYDTSVSNPVFSVTISNDEVYLNNDRFLYHNFTEGSYKFDLAHNTNTNHQLYFSRDPYSITPYYDASVNQVGTSGQSGAYTTVTVPSDFSGNLYYLNAASVIERDFTYYVKLAYNAYNQPAFAFATNQSGPYYNQVDLSFNAPNKYYFEYYFDMASGYAVEVSTTEVSYTGAAFTASNRGSHAYKIFDNNNTTMADIYASSTTYNGSTGVHNGTVATNINGTNVNGEWIEVQFTSEITIRNYEIRLRSDLVPIERGYWRYDNLSSNNRMIKEFYLVGSNNRTSWTELHHHIVTTNERNNSDLHMSPLYSLSSYGEYKYYRLVVPRIMISTSHYLSPSEINLYAEDVNSNETANEHTYELDFGTVVDSSTVYTGTVRKETTPGEYRSAVYLDLSGYSGSTLYAYHDGSANMGYSPPPASPDFTYTVTVSNNIFYLNGVESPQIDFDANKTYLFVQSDSTNIGHPIVFGKLPDDDSLIVSEGIKIVGSLGQPEAYTLVTIPSDFTDSLFYFHATVENQGPPVEFDISYNVKVVQNILSQNVYSISTAGGPYYNQPDISFTGPNKKYYFDIGDSSNTGYKIVFGTTIDSSVSIYDGTVYSSTGNSDGDFVFLDLTDYSGQPLYLFDETNAKMGYYPPSTPNNEYDVTLTSNQHYINLNGTEELDITFTASQTYVFKQHHSSNIGSQLMFSQLHGKTPYYTTNYEIVGSLGQPSAYTQLVLDANFNGDMYYFLKQWTREYNYYMKVTQNYKGENVFTMSDVNASATHYIQPVINFTAPNRYYFEVEDSTNSGYQIVFGTTPDDSNSVTESIVSRGNAHGTANAFVFLDLSSYSGSTLYYFDATNTDMGYYDSTGTNSYTVTLSSNDFYLNSSRYPVIDFTASTTYKFIQSHTSNANYQLYLSRNPYSITPFFTSNLLVKGTPGQTGAYSLLDLSAGFNDPLYYVNGQSTLSQNIKYYVKITNNAYNQPTYTFSTSYDGPYYNHKNLTFTSPNQYVIEYYFDFSNPSSNTHNYPVEFGLVVDDSSTYSGTVYKESTSGSYRTVAYLDLSSYSGNTLYAYSTNATNMGYSPPPANPDFTYVVTVSGGIFYLDGVQYPLIDFDANKTYLFIQSDSTNVGHPMIFGRLPDDTQNIIEDGIKIVGTLGQPEAYTLVTTPADFNDSMFYFHATVENKGPEVVFDISYTVKIVQNILDEFVYSVSTAGGTFYNQPDISFTGPNKRYYFEVSDFYTNSARKLVFGTTVDDSNTIYSGIVYSDPNNSDGQFILLDLTDYTGSPLYLFDEYTAAMGYVPYDSTGNIYNVTMSTDQLYMFLDTVESPQITFQPSQSYVFLQEDTTNVSYQLMFSQTYGMLPYYVQNYTVVGSLGRPGAYTQVQVPSNFTGSLFYFLKSLTREYTYYVKVNPNYLSENVFTISDTNDLGPHYNQKYLTFTSPNRYYFEVEDSTNSGYEMVFGSTADASNSLISSSFITRGRTPGNGNNAFVYLDCSTHDNTFLYYFDSSYSNMGWYELQPVEGGSFVNNSTLHAIIVSNGDFYRNSDRYPLIDFVNGVTQKFTQDISSNTNYQIYFSKDPYLYTSPPYSDIEVSIVGVAGQTGSQTSVYVPNALTENLYYIHQQAELSRSHKYYVKRVYNAYNEPAFSFSTTYDGSYVQQQDLSFNANNQYYFEHYFDTSNPSNNTHYYQISFGEVVDSTNVYTSTVTYKETIEGSYRSAVYLDLSGYSGNTLYAYNLVKPFMSYSPPPSAPDFSYNVTVSGGLFYLNNVAAPYIDFDANKTYLFIQSDSTNSSNPMVFGKLPDDQTTLVKEFVKIIGTPGTEKAYTLVTIPADFKDSLYYFHPTVSGKGPSLEYDISHQIIVRQNVKGENVYAIQYPSEPDISSNYQTIINSASWSQASIDISGVATNDSFGSSIAFNATGNIIAISAPDNDTNGNSSGHVRVFELLNGTWTQIGNTIYGEFAFDYLGTSTALSSNGHTVAIGSPGQNGDIKVYTYNGTNAWTLVGSVISGDNSNDGFGKSVALSDDGTIVAGGGELSGANGTYSGYVKVYQYDGSTWNKLGNNINGDNTYDYFGISLTMSNDGNSIAIGATQSQIGTTNNGYVKIYSWSGSNWTQNGNTISGQSTGDHFGTSISLDGTGERIAIGGINHTTSNGLNSGHVQVYDLSNSTWTQVGNDIEGSAQEDQFGCSVSLNDDGTILAIGGKNNDTNGSNSGHVQVYKWNNFNWVALGNDFVGSSSDDLFGHAVSINKAGTRVAIGAPSNDTYGLNSGLVQLYDLTASFGSRYNGPREYYNQPLITFSAPNKYWFTIPQTVYTRTLHQIGTDIEGQASDDYFGSSTALSADGTVLAIGAPNNNTSGTDSGQVKVLVWNGSTWTQRGLSLNGQAADDLFGTSVSLSSNGSILAVGSPLNDTNGSNRGKVNVYTWSGSAWVSKGSALNGTNNEDQFGYHIQLSEDGNALAIGARLHDTSGTDSGQVKVYIWSSNTWVQRGNEINGINSYDYLGHSVSLSSNGTIVAIGSIYSDVNTSNDGAVYVYIWDGYEWTARGEVLNGEADTNEFGHSIHLSSDGDTLAVSGIKNDNNGTYSGATYVYSWNGVTWTQKGSTLYGEAANDYFGYAVRLSSDGNILVSSSHMNDGNGSDSGHVRIYKYSGSNWSQILNDIDGEAANDQSGYSLSLSADGRIVAIGARYNDGNGSNSGHVRVYKVGHHVPVFGTTPEDKSTIYNGTLYSDEFQSDVYVYLDLTDYTGNDLHIFNETTTNMGYVSPITPNNAYAVTMSSNQYHIFLDGVDNPTINFQANQTYLFTQDDSSNVEYQIVFGATHGKVPLYETNYIIMGSLGRPGAYTQLSLPYDFTGNMDYFLKSLIRDTNYFVKVVTNHLNKPVLAIADTLNGTYYQQLDISFSSPNIYFFDVADVTNDAHVLEFGTSYDSSNNSATIIHSRDPGVSGAFTFLDLSAYSGNTLYYSSDVSSGMGFNPYVLDTNTLITYPNENDNFNSILDTSYSTPFTYTKLNHHASSSSIGQGLPTKITITPGNTTNADSNGINSIYLTNGTTQMTESINPVGTIFYKNTPTSIEYNFMNTGSQLLTDGIRIGVNNNTIRIQHIKLEIMTSLDVWTTVMDASYSVITNGIKINENSFHIFPFTQQIDLKQFTVNSTNYTPYMMYQGAHNLFKYNQTTTTNFFHPGTASYTPDYTGAVVTNGVYGEWIQYEIPSVAKIRKYSFTPRSYTSENSGLPDIGSLFGSTNGTSWTLIDDVSQNGTPITTMTVNDTNDYNYFRFVAQSITSHNTTISNESYFDPARWNLQFSYNITKPIIAVTISNDNILLDGILTSQFSYEAGQKYVFDQTDSTNSGNILYISYSPYQIAPQYTQGVINVGTPGQPSAYTEFTVAENLTDNLYLIVSAKEIYRDFTYFVKIQNNALGEPVFSLATDRTGNYILQKDLSLNSPNIYYFDLVDSTNSIATIQFGTTMDISASINTTDVSYINTLGTSKAYAIVDLSGYTGDTLYYFNENIPNMGYVPVTSTIDFSYNVTVSNEQFYLNDSPSPQITFEAGKNYYFDQTHPSNTGYPFVLGKQPDSAVDIYSDNFVTVGTAGQNEAYSFATLPTDFTGDLFYYSTDISGMGNTMIINATYYVKVTKNVVGKNIFSISQNNSTGPYYNQESLPLITPNRYYFDTSDPTNEGYKISFGTQTDNPNTVHNQSITYMNNNSAVYINLSNYLGGTLYYFGADLSNVINEETGNIEEDISYNENMGFIPVPILQQGQGFTYVVTVANNIFYINGLEKTSINFTPGQIYLFDQSDSSNLNNQLRFGRLPDDQENILTTGVTIVGSAGRPGSYTSVVLSNDFKDALFYFNPNVSSMGNALLIDTTYYVKVVQNILGENVYAFSTSASGPFYNQSNITFTAPTRYYFDVSDPSNEGYKLVFGTQVDNLSTIYTGTTYDEIVDGNVGAFVYLDLADYTGLTLYAFEETNTQMGYIAPPSTINVYNVTMSSNQYNIYLDGIISPTINFTFGQTYVFTQHHATNTNYRIVFAETKYKLPLYTNGNVKVVGTLGQPGAYTSITIPSDFFGTLHYFVQSRIADETYYVKVLNNSLGNPIFALTTEYNAARYYNQKNISFTSGTVHFDVSHESNLSYIMRFGTTFDNTSTNNESVITRSTTISPGSTDSFIYMDLSGYSGDPLMYYEQNTTNMGYMTPPSIPSNQYVIQVSMYDEVRSFDKTIPAFTANSTYLFWQTDPTNDGYDHIVVGRIQDSEILYTTGVYTFGTPGEDGAYTYIQLPSDFTGSLYPYVLTQYPRDVKYYAKIGTIPKRGDEVYSFSNTRNGTYQTNQTTLITAPNKYFINKDDFLTENYKLVFGTEIDNSGAIPSVVQIYHTFIYIDLSTYTGDDIHYYDSTIENMGDLFSSLKVGLKKIPERVNQMTIPNKREFTKNKIKTFINRSSNTNNLRLSKDEMVGYTFNTEISSVLIVENNTTFTKFDLLDTGIYALLENTNDSLTVPSRSDTITITNTGNGNHSVTNVNGNVLYSALQSGNNITYDSLNIQIGSAGVSLNQKIICFKRDTKILCLTENTFEEKYIKVQQLKPGMLVKTYKHGFVPLYSIGHRTMKNTSDSIRVKNRLYECNAQNYPEIFETLVLTGCHSILKDSISSELRQKLKQETKGKIYCTDEKYRVMAYLDTKAKPYKKAGEFEIWHFSLEHSDDYMNYGIYANGLLVETASKRMMADYSDMVLNYK